MTGRGRHRQELAAYARNANTRRRFGGGLRLCALFLVSSHSVAATGCPLFSPSQRPAGRGVSPPTRRSLPYLPAAGVQPRRSLAAGAAGCGWRKRCLCLRAVRSGRICCAVKDGAGIPAALTCRPCLPTQARSLVMAGRTAGRRAACGSRRCQPYPAPCHRQPSSLRLLGRRFDGGKAGFLLSLKTRAGRRLEGAASVAGDAEPSGLTCTYTFLF